MDKLKLSTVTPSKKKKQEINYKTKMKKLIKNKNITKDGDIFVHGAYKRSGKAPQVKILTDITTLLLKSVEEVDVPVSVDTVKGGDVVAKPDAENCPDERLSSRQDLKHQQTGHNVLRVEKLKNNVLSKGEKQNPEVAETRYTLGRKTDMSTVVKCVAENGGTAEVVPEAGGNECLNIERASKKVADIEVSRVPEICVTGAGGGTKRRKKRKRKNSNVDCVSGVVEKFGVRQDSVSRLSDTGKGLVSQKEKARSGERKSEEGITRSFQVSDLSPDMPDTRGKEMFGGRRDSGSLKGATNGLDGTKERRNSGGRKSDTGISQGFQISNLSPDKSERNGKKVLGERRFSGILKEATNSMDSTKEQRRAGGRKSDKGISQGFQISDLSPDKSETHGKEVLGERQISGSFKEATNSTGSTKEQRRAGRRKSDKGISQGFQISDLSPDKFERHGKDVLGERQISGSLKEATSSMGSNKEQKRAGGRKSDKGIKQGFQVSDWSRDESERLGMVVFGERRNSGSLKEATNGMGSNKERRRADGRKGEAEISQDFQISDLSPDDCERPDSFSTTSLSKDMNAHKKYMTSGVSGSSYLGKLTVNSKLDKPKSKDSSKRHTKSDDKVENNGSEMKGVSGTLVGLQVLSSTLRVPEVLDAKIGSNISQKQQNEEEKNNKEKNVLGSEEPINLEDVYPSTWEPENITEKEQVILPRNDTNTLVSNGENRKILKKGKVCDTGICDRLEPDGEKSEEVWILDSSDTDSEEDRHLILNKNGTEHTENNSTSVRRETRRTLSIESDGTPNLMSDRLCLMRGQEVPEQSYVRMEGFLQFKRSRSSECEAVEAEAELDLQFYYLPDSRYVLLLKQNSVVHFRGKLTLTALAGGVEILGCVLKRTGGQSRVSVFSPRGSSLLALEVPHFDERRDCKEVAVQAVTSVGLRKREVHKIESNFEEGDCLLLLEAATSLLYSYLSRHLPGELIPIVKRTKVEPSKHSVKELQCTFYLSNTKENVKMFVKNAKWEPIVSRILDQNPVDRAASCTMLCGGKGVGKSTLLRYLVNRVLRRHSRVLCLDFDPGQAEFTVPGCLSAVLVDRPLLGPNYTHLTVPEKSVYLGHVDVSQCPLLYLEAATYIINYCRDNPEFFGIPWFVNTMGFCKGLGVELTNTMIQMVRPTDLVQIQSRSYQRNFPKELCPQAVAKYRSPFRYVPRSEETVDYEFHLVRSSAEKKLEGEEAEWGFAAHKLRDIVILSYLSQMVKTPTYSLTEIVPYMTSLSSLKLRICHEPVSPSNVLSVLNGCVVALCRTEDEGFLQPSEPDLPRVFQQTPVCDCLGFGVIRGVDIDTKKLFLITPIPAEHLKLVNCLVMGVVQLPACVVIDPVGVLGHVPYVTVGPGQATGRTSRKLFTQLLLAGAV